MRSAQVSKACSGGHARLNGAGKAACAVVNGQDVNLLLAHKPVNDPVGRMDHFAHRWIRKLRDGPAGLWEVTQPLGCGNQLGHDDGRVVRRVLADEGVDGSEVVPGLVGPEQKSHERNRLLTSS